MHPTMATEKVAPPEIVLQGIPTQTIATPESKKFKTALVVYSSVVTALLVAVIIMGGVYYHSSMTRLMDINDDYRKKYEVNSGDNVKESVEIDTKNDIEIFYPKGEGIPQGTMAVLDFKKSITAIYDPSQNQCFLHGGIDSRISNPSELKNELDKNTTLSTAAEAFNYKRVDSYPIRDSSVIPGPLKKTCANLQSYWMTRADDKATDTDLSKRGCFYRCYYFVYRGRLYRYCYRYCYA